MSAHMKGLSPCEISGLLGTCGMDCKALQDGDCEDKERLEEFEMLIVEPPNKTMQESGS